MKFLYYEAKVEEYYGRKDARQDARDRGTDREQEFPSSEIPQTARPLSERFVNAIKMQEEK